MPINEDFTLLDLAIHECAAAGAKSIWISINDDWAPVIKKRLGEYVLDPVWDYRTFDPEPAQSKKVIPIFLVPCLPKFYKTRDSEGWGYINSAIYAIKTTGKISSFLTPDVFYACSPFVVYEPGYITQFRRNLLEKKRFMFSNGNKHFLNDNHLSFTFLKEDITQVRQYLNKNATMKYVANEEYEKTGKGSILVPLPKEERYSGRFFGLNDLFSHIDINDYQNETINPCYEINNWEDYRRFMREGEEFKKPKILKRESIYKLYEEKL